MRVDGEGTVGGRPGRRETADEKPGSIVNDGTRGGRRVRDGEGKAVELGKGLAGGGSVRRTFGLGGIRCGGEKLLPRVAGEQFPLGRSGCQAGQGDLREPCDAENPVGSQEHTGQAGEGRESSG